MTQKVGQLTFMTTKKLGDFYWAYADILRGIGINESMYDQRIMAFMALKLLVDNDFLSFTFEYQNNFGLKKSFDKYKAKDTKETFLNIIDDIENLGTTNLKYFTQDKELNPDSESQNILHYLNHKKTFQLKHYIEELPNNYLEMVLDIYNEKAHFVNYPKEQYKDLYEKTISRMKKLSGDLTGQHFTQKSIIHLMCSYALKDLLKSKRDVLAIYDPTCGTGSMLMESAYYFDEKLNYTEKGNKKKNSKSIEVYGQEMHGQTWLLCKIFLEICSIPNKIAHGNTLTNPAFEKINGDNSFDFIIANPPFGVDWKQDYDAVIKDMKKSDFSHFYIIKDEKGYVTPKKSDGQFLFMMHILKLLQKSKESKKHAKAVVVSSTGLITSGKETSAEGKIRKDIFTHGFVDTLLEQPKAMFTNTDISTLLWFFDNQIGAKNQNETYLIKVDNSYINKHFKNKELKVLFNTSAQKIEKQKNSYSEENINTIQAMIEDKIQFPLFAKSMQFDDKYTINFENELSYDIDISTIAKINKFDISHSYQALTLALLFQDEVSQKYKEFGSYIDILSSYIDGTYTDKFYKSYQDIYRDTLQMVQSNKKDIDKTFQNSILKQKQKEYEEINHIFDAIKDINSKATIRLDMQ